MKKAILLLGAPLFLFAYTIDFETSLNKTIQNNKGLKAKKLEIDASKEELNEVKGYNYGSLVFNENISRTNNAGYVFGMKMASREASFGDFGFNEFLTPLGGAIYGASQGQAPSDMSGLLATEPEDLNNPDARTNYETKVTYKVPLFTGFKLQNGKKMAKLQVLAKSALYNYDKKALGLEVLKAYNGAVASKEFIKATKKAKEATNSFVNFANELYNEGLVTNIDVKQALVYDMGVDTHMIEAKNRYDLALSYLRFLTSDDTITDVKEFQNISNDNLELNSLQDKAHTNRDDFLSMQYNKDTMKIKIDYESSNNYPTIGAQLEYGYNDNSLNNINSDHDYYLGAVGLSYTLFDGFISNSKKQKAKIEYKKTKNYFEYMKDGIKLEIEKNILNLQAKEKILKQKIKAQNLAQEVLEQSQEMYKNQLINMSNLLMQQAASQQANAQTIMAKYEKSLAAATLKISLGDTLQKGVDNVK
ncbi:MAG: TolC family protein [Campylobacterota bacterium]|nr:TolC family protein [Campylobacterota bacterium]